MKKSLSSKLLFWFLFLAITPLLIFTINSYNTNANMIKELAMNELKNTARLQTRYIENWFKYRYSDISTWSESSQTVHILEKLLKLQEKDESKQDSIKSNQHIHSIKTFENDFKTLKKHYTYLHDIFLIGKQGNILYSLAKEEDLGTNLLHGQYSQTRFANSFKKTIKDSSIHFSDIEYYQPSKGKIVGFITAPLISDAGQLIGVFALQFKWDEFNNLFKQNMSSKNYIVGLDGFLRTDISNEKKALKHKMNSVYHLEDSQEHIHNHQVLEKEEIILMHSDIDIYGVKWVLINELKHDTLIESKKELTESLLLFLAIVIIIVFIVSRYIALKILKPLSKLAQASKEYVTGSRKTILNDSDDKEIYELTVSFNTMLVVLSENEKLLNNYTLELEDKIAKEIEKNTIHQQALFKQTRLAQMGEMISMIAHQWRQPLGAITATDIDLKIKIELGIYDLKKEEDRKLFEAYFLEGLDNIENLAQGLTTTIDDFKNFYKPNKIFNLVEVSIPIEKALNIIIASLTIDNIEVIKGYTSKKKMNLLDSEVMQVILNIIKNAQDNFKIKKTKKPSICIDTFDIENGIIINISDNGGGINADIIDNIFDPYFSTKHEKNGTGLGLYMSKMIIEDHHRGTIKALNIDGGICFCIEIKNK